MAEAPNKPLLFVSHISDEKEVAVALKELVDRELLNMIDVFLSSDEATIALGQKCLDGYDVGGLTLRAGTSW